MIIRNELLLIFFTWISSNNVNWVVTPLNLCRFGSSEVSNTSFVLCCPFFIFRELLANTDDSYSLNSRKKYEKGYPSIHVGFDTDGCKDNQVDKRNHSTWGEHVHRWSKINICLSRLVDTIVCLTATRLACKGDCKKDAREYQKCQSGGVWEKHKEIDWIYQNGDERPEKAFLQVLIAEVREAVDETNIAR